MECKLNIVQLYKQAKGRVNEQMEQMVQGVAIQIIDWDTISADFGINSNNISLLRILIESDEDYNDFIENYWQGSNRQFFAVEEYREFKLQSKPVSESYFLKKASEDLEKSLEKLFLHPISLSAITILQRKLDNEEITLQELYHKHMEEPSLNLLAHLL